MKEDVFNISTPTVVVSRMSGKDPNYYAVDSSGMVISFDSEPYVSRAVVVTSDSENVKTIVGYSDRTPSPTATDIHGNTISRTLMVETSGAPVAVATYLLSQLNDHATIAQIDISTNFEEMAQGTFQVGDAFYAYDPPAIVNKKTAKP